MSQLTSARSVPRAHRLAADQHLVERDVEHVVAAPQIDADRIADRDEIEAGAVGDARDLIIPGDDADALFAVALHLLQRGNGHLSAMLMLPSGRCSSTAGGGGNNVSAFAFGAITGEFPQATVLAPPRREHQL